MGSANMAILTCIIIVLWAVVAMSVLILLCGNLTKHETKRMGMVAVLTHAGALFATHLTTEKAQNAQKLDHKYNRIDSR